MTLLGPRLSSELQASLLFLGQDLVQSSPHLYYLLLNDCLWTCHHFHRRGKKVCFFRWIVICFVFITQVKMSEQFGPLSLTLSLDDGVPVKVVLDVVRSQHASHLEVSQRESSLLLAQLAQVAWTQKQRSHTLAK